MVQVQRGLEPQRPLALQPISAKKAVTKRPKAGKTLPKGGNWQCSPSLESPSLGLR